MLQIKVNQLETIILKLVTKQELDEKQQKAVNKILEKRGVANSTEEES